MPANDLKLFTALTVAIVLALPMFGEYLNTIKIPSGGETMLEVKNLKKIFNAGTINERLLWTM